MSLCGGTPCADLFDGRSRYFWAKPYQEEGRGALRNHSLDHDVVQTELCKSH